MLILQAPTLKKFQHLVDINGPNTVKINPDCAIFQINSYRSEEDLVQCSNGLMVIEHWNNSCSILFKFCLPTPTSTTKCFLQGMLIIIFFRKKGKYSGLSWPSKEWVQSQRLLRFPHHRHVLHVIHFWETAFGICDKGAIFPLLVLHPDLPWARQVIVLSGLPKGKKCCQILLKFYSPQMKASR